MLIDSESFTQWTQGIADSCVAFNDACLLNDQDFIDPEKAGHAFALMAINRLMEEYALHEEKGLMLYAFSCGMQRGINEALATTHPSMFQDTSGDTPH